MAKAIFGHLGAPDPRRLVELRRLQDQVRHLEDEVLRLRAENAALLASLDSDDLLVTGVKEPALT
jgi:hypothetical protein